MNICDGVRGMEKGLRRGSEGMGHVRLAERRVALSLDRHTSRHPLRGTLSEAHTPGRTLFASY